MPWECCLPAITYIELPPCSGSECSVPPARLSNVCSEHSPELPPVLGHFSTSPASWTQCSRTQLWDPTVVQARGNLCPSPAPGPRIVLLVWPRAIFSTLSTGTCCPFNPEQPSACNTPGHRRVRLCNPQQPSPTLYCVGGVNWTHHSGP